jgi:hypothetical protein
MVRNIFRTAFIGMMAVAGLFLLFFILKVILFFFVAGFLARMAMKYFRQKQMGEYSGMTPVAIHGRSSAEPLFGNGHQPRYYGGYNSPAYGQSSAIVEITR